MKRTEAQTGLVTCRNSKGVPVRGSLLHVSGHGVVFEVYNPFSLVQLSEVLTDVRIEIGQRTLYSGRATTSNLLNAGIMLIVEVALIDPLAMAGPEAELPGSDEFRREVDDFLTQWRTGTEVLDEFKVAVNDMRSFLLDLSLWLNQTEFVLRGSPARSAQQEFALVDAIAAPVRPVLREFFARLTALGVEIPPERSAAHRTYLCRALHPVMMCSPFIYRTVVKPLGYAGDYEMINMLLSEPRRGETLFAKTLNALVLEVDAAEAHRNRVKMLTRILTEESARARAEGRRLKVLNVACGPSREVVDFIRTSPDASIVDITLLDFSPEALEFARAETERARRETGSSIGLTFVEKSVDILLRESGDTSSASSVIRETYDLIYCAGLFDYFIDGICSRLMSLYYRQISPGGLVVATNLHPRNPVRFIMDYLLTWVVVHRDEAQMKSLDRTGGLQTVVLEPTGVNIFLAVRRPQEHA